MRASHPISNPLGTWRGKALLRFFLLVVAAAAVAAFASRFGVSHDYAYLHASLLAGAPRSVRGISVITVNFSTRPASRLV